MRKGFLALLTASVTIVCILSTQTGCTFENEEEFYAGTACDTSTVTYSATVRPVLTQSCTSCHSVNGGNYPDMEEYVNIKDYIDLNPPGIPDRIRHQPGVSPMPQGAAKLAECDIRKIEIWIAAGYPNN